MNVSSFCKNSSVVCKIVLFLWFLPIWYWWVPQISILICVVYAKLIWLHDKKTNRSINISLLLLLLLMLHTYQVDHTPPAVTGGLSNSKFPLAPRVFFCSHQHFQSLEISILPFNLSSTSLSFSNFFIIGITFTFVFCSLFFFFFLVRSWYLSFLLAFTCNSVVCFG